MIVTWGPLLMGGCIIGTVGYLFLTDTLGHIRRAAQEDAKPPIAPGVAGLAKPLPSRDDVRAVLRLQLCSMLLFATVPLAGLAGIFGMPGYWIAGPALVLGFWAGRLWELLKGALG